MRSFETEVLGGAKGALGQLARLSLACTPDTEDAPRTLIAKFAAADPETRAIHNVSGFYEREVQFYLELAPHSVLRTPRCYCGDVDTDTGKCVLLLEDLAPARNGDRAAGCSLAEAELALREVALFHAAWWENPQLDELAWLRPFGSDVRQMWQGAYQQSWGPFVERMGSCLPAPILDLGERFTDRAASFLEQSWGSPRTLVHNDYMLDNFFFATAAGGAPFAVIDWQLLTQGRGALDAASFLGGNLPTEVRRTHELGLLRTYHAVLVERGVQGYPFDRCLEDYRFSMLDGLFRIVVALGGEDLRAEQERTHRDVIWPRFCAALLDLNVGELLPD